MVPPLTFPKGLQTAACLLLLLLVGGGILYQAHTRRQARGLEREAQRATTRQAAHAELVRRADSLANFTAGRLYQQRLDTEKLRRKDETHQTARPVSGPLRLPELPAR